VYGNAVVGIAPTSTAINAYQAVITSQPAEERTFNDGENFPFLF